VRVLADGQTHTQTQTDFIICPMLYAIAMGQIMMRSVVFDKVLVRTSNESFAIVATAIVYDARNYSNGSSHELE